MSSLYLVFNLEAIDVGFQAILVRATQFVFLVQLQPHWKTHRLSHVLSCLYDIAPDGDSVATMALSLGPALKLSRDETTPL
jgi:hypothetical protein